MNWESKDHQSITRLEIQSDGTVYLNEHIQKKIGWVRDIEKAFNVSIVLLGPGRAAIFNTDLDRLEKRDFNAISDFNKLAEVGLFIARLRKDHRIALTSAARAHLLGNMERTGACWAQAEDNHINLFDEANRQSMFREVMDSSFQLAELLGELSGEQ